MDFLYFLSVYQQNSWTENESKGGYSCFPLPSKQTGTFGKHVSVFATHLVHIRNQIWDVVEMQLKGGRNCAASFVPTHSFPWATFHNWDIAKLSHIYWVTCRSVWPKFSEFGHNMFQVMLPVMCYFTGTKTMTKIKTAQPPMMSLY